MKKKFIYDIYAMNWTNMSWSRLYIIDQQRNVPLLPAGFLDWLLEHWVDLSQYLYYLG